ncbi:MAG: hypothetical protein HQL33_03310 [Alphaproteobacteria bacterium]|nr:hypothetical protein [Alphaproteobacteria bacterium]
MATFFKPALCALAILVAAASSSGVRAGGSGVDAGFLSGIEDLPLMEGLTERLDAGSTFDTPAGRFVEAYATGGRATRRQIEDFYAATLPQLGWAASGRLAFRRDGETLRIEILGGKPPYTIRFALAPE